MRKAKIHLLLWPVVDGERGSTHRAFILSGALLEFFLSSFSLPCRFWQLRETFFQAGKSDRRGHKGKFTRDIYCDRMGRLALPLPLIDDNDMQRRDNSLDIGLRVSFCLPQFSLRKQQ